MEEKLLQFIWHHQSFNMIDLKVLDGRSLSVQFPGRWNHDQGPDFLMGRIRLGDQEWAGHIELHIHTSEWDSHGHDQDKHYHNVILHVVWRHDRPIAANIPVLELEPRVPFMLLQRYRKWMSVDHFIPCASQFKQEVIQMIPAYLDWLYERRVLKKSQGILSLVRSLDMDWEEAFWRKLARAFGHQVNADAFEHMATTIPYKLLLHHRHQQVQIEGLLMGQAGLLPAAGEDIYANKLIEEHAFLVGKYRLSAHIQAALFLRMRPKNFPTIRLAQLAALIVQQPDLFRKLKNGYELEDVYVQFDIETSPYWQTHFRFGEVSAFQQKTIGRSFIHRIMVNTIIPFLRAYSIYTGDELQERKISQWVKNMQPEQNSVIAGFNRLGYKARHIGDSQALMELKSAYCEKLRCLQCGIGAYLLSR